MPPKSSRLLQQQLRRTAAIEVAPPPPSASATAPPSSGALPPAAPSPLSLEAAFSTTIGCLRYLYRAYSTAASPTTLVAAASTAPIRITTASTTSATPDNDEPVEAPLRIRCSNKDGVAPIKRRTVVSNKTQALMKTSERIKVEWSSFHSGPSSIKIHNLLVRDMGLL